MAFVTVRIKGTEGYTRSALDKERVVVGRSSSTDLPIRSTTISREHCALERQEGRWFVVDLGSSNGTRVGDQRLDAHGRRELQERDIIKAGKARLTFHAGSLTEAELAAVEVGDDDEPDAPRRVRGADDPPEACPCAFCGGWFSIAHRTAGDRMDCPRCGKSNLVPELVNP
jgi:pSer/pThr/pTyr-binding forkhead associated (FHA) protein